MRTVLAAVALALLGVALTPLPSHADAVKLDPLTLPQGRPAAVAHVEGNTIVDGRHRIRVRSAEWLHLAGEVGGSYVVDVRLPHRRGYVALVDRDGTERTLLRDGPYTSMVGEDGAMVVSARTRTYRKTTLTAISTATWAPTATHVVRDQVDVLAVRGTEAVLGGLDRPGTVRWETSTGVVTPLTDRLGTRASYRLDLLASFTKSTLNDGCTVVSRLSDPAVVLWRSCEEAVNAFSTDGTQLLTSYILGEGYPGTSRVTRRTVTGTPLASYRPRGGVILETWFEHGSTPLIEVALRHATGRNTGVVRCTDDGCERAGSPYRLDDVFS